MLLKLREDKRLVKVEDLKALQNPFQSEIEARLQYGEEEQDPRPYNKEALCFPSGEALPRCWRDAHYRDEEVEKHRMMKGSE